MDKQRILSGIVIVVGILCVLLFLKFCDTENRLYTNKAAVKFESVEKKP